MVLISPGRSRLLFVGALLFVTFVLAVPLQAQVAYGTDRESTLYRIDLNTGAATVIGDLGIGPVATLAIDPATGILYTNPGGGGCCPTPTSGCVYTVNAATGAATLVGCDPNQGGNDPIKGMAFGPNGVFYGLRLASNAEPEDDYMWLCTIDRATGNLTDIGQTVEWVEGHGTEFGSDGRLYSWDSTNGLMRVSTATGSATMIGGDMLGFPEDDGLRVSDMARDRNGVLWALVVSGEPPDSTYFTATVDTVSGDITYVATLDANIQTLAIAPVVPVPAVTPWGLVLLAIGTALAAVFVVAKRGLA